MGSFCIPDSSTVTVTKGTVIFDDAKSKFDLTATSADIPDPITQVTLTLTDPSVTATFNIGCDPITGLQFTSSSKTPDDFAEYETTLSVAPGGQAVTIPMPAIAITTATGASKCPLYFKDETDDLWKN